MGRKSRKKEAITEDRCVFIRPTGAVCNAIVVATVTRGDESRQVCTEHRRALYAEGYTE